MTSLVTKAPGKVVIAGEYAVLFGHQAIVTAIDRKATSVFTPGPVFEFFMKTGSEPVQKNDHTLFISALTTCRDEGFFALQGKYLIDTCAFYNSKNQQKLGLGSSAAAMAALCKMILAQNEVYDSDHLFMIAYKAHRDFSQGLGSGIDVAASVFGGTISYFLGENGPKINKLNLKMDHILIIDTKRAQDTKPFVENVLKLEKLNPDFLADFCRSSSSLCNTLIDADGDLLCSINVFEQLYHLLKELGHHARIDIISKEHEKIHNIAKTFSGSAKPSGAGGGDLCLALVPPHHRTLFIDKIHSYGFSTVSLRLLT